MYFNHHDNVATIDGRTLRVKDSWMTFGSNFLDPAHYGTTTFKNSATLDVSGEVAKLTADNVDFSHCSLVMTNINTVPAAVRAAFAADWARLLRTTDKLRIFERDLIVGSDERLSCGEIPRRERTSRTSTARRWRVAHPASPRGRIRRKTAGLTA